MTVTIRRPYNVPIGRSEQELWFDAGEKNAKDYAQHATINNDATLEALAQVGTAAATTAMNSNGNAPTPVSKCLVLLHETATIRYSINQGRNWVRLGNVEEDPQLLDPLVEYTDDDGNVASLDLQTQYLRLRASRERYCFSVVSAAETLRAEQAKKPKDAPPAAQPRQQQRKPKSPPDNVEDGGVSVGAALVGGVWWMIQAIVLLVVSILRTVVAFVAAAFLVSVFYLYVASSSASAYHQHELLHNLPGIL